MSSIIPTLPAAFVILFNLALLCRGQECKINLKDACNISSAHGIPPRDELYVNMCNCSETKPTFCSGETCTQCLLGLAPCTLDFNSSTKCCPVLNARAFCNVNSGKCEVSRFCGRRNGSPCPFDDLSALEIISVMSIIRQSGKFPSTVQYPVIRNKEPSKSDWNAGKRIPRIGYAAVWDPEANTLTEVLVDFEKNKILELTILKNQLPRRMTYEKNVVAKVLQNDPQWRAAMLKRNLDPAKATFRGATIGSSGPIWDPGTFVTKVMTFYKDSEIEMWRIVEGILVTVDLRKGVVLGFLDVETTNVTSGFSQYPNFDTKPPLKPLVITQKQGTSIFVKGQAIKWYKWKLRYSMDPIHGLQLFHVRFQADCENRLVLYKISLGEMFVPYGARGVNWRFKSPFDAGEIGMGIFANPLKIGIDLPENAIQLPCVIADDTGAEPFTVPGCIGVYERDMGTLYKHTDWSSKQSNGRRGRQLVITYTTSLGNYDYGFDYILNMDGTIEVKVRLVGVIYPKGVKQQVNNPSCIEDCISLTHDYLTAPTHQHFFNFRMDFDVDGINNYVTEVNVENDPIGPDNLDGGAFSARKKIMANEGFRDYNFSTARTWHVINTNSRNRFGSPRGYAVKPADTAYLYLHKGNPYLPQAQFAEHAFWATVYNDKEQSSGGNFPRSGIPGQGLPEFVQDRESLQNKDAVLWYTFGVTHTTRPEEWPFMNVHVAGFSLVPYNFMSQNSEVPLKGKCP